MNGTQLQRWLGRLLLWLGATILWAVAGVAAGAPPSEAFRVGAIEMTLVAAFAPAVWWLTGRFPLRPRGPAFLLTHVVTAVALVFAYSMVLGIAVHGFRSWREALTSTFSSTIAGWNMFIGTFLYLVMAVAMYLARTQIALRESERVQSEARVAARDAQLAALSAQLQPHFLFNALHTVGTLVHTDAEQADHALDHLGQLLRYALRSPGDDVLLRDDWRFACDYLAFERLRLGDRLRVTTSIDADALLARVPPFTVQPLVENAVLHGIAPTTEPGDLSVAIRRERDVVAIDIINSLPGVPGEGRTGATGHSLARLRERLELRFGIDRVSVGIATEANRYAVTVRLPALDESASEAPR